jgi:NitT/TauT family transport system ATP-binding protein
VTRPGGAGTEERGGARLLEVEGVTVRYPLRGGTTKLVLNDVSIRVREHEFVTLVGPTGCGKSTLLRLVLGSERPTSGSVRFDGREVEGVGKERGIVYQKYSLFPHVSVVDNIALGLLLRDTSIPERLNPLHWPGFFRLRKRCREHARGLVDRVGLAHADCDKYPHELSGGMRQRVAIAQALVMEPKLLLMDEPFGALDHTTRESMQLFLLERWEELGMTIVFVTHDLEEACYLGGRIVGLSQYWTADDGALGEGAKIVIDKRTPGKDLNPTSFKYAPDFASFLEKVRREVLDPEHKRKLSQFDLDHQDAIRPQGRAMGGADGR